tara:strand:+ start:21235 stop:21993 length:759 start_codon:yes stop_codon:yes gene_type:complete
MIKFFRKIRQNSLMKNKTGKYFKYAIGEVLLVVVGILIAVQINNWNENKNSRIREIKTLSQLNEDFKENFKEISGIKEYMAGTISAGRKIINHLENETKVTDSLRFWVERYSGANIFNKANTTYKNIENSEENIITNDSIRLQITLMYETEFENIHKREMMMKEDHYHRYTTELHKNFKTGKIADKWIEGSFLDVNTPINFTELKKNELYKNTFVDLYNFRLLRIKWLTQTIKSLETLISDIDREIKLLKSN